MPSIYVGTYAKYNAGSIAGEWVDLDIYSDKGLFYDHIAELHKDEKDPEYMFQDIDGVPRALYHESSLDDRLWDWLELDEHERKVCAAAWEGVDGSMDIQDALERLSGVYESEEAWAEEFLNDCGALEGMPENLRGYFDYESYARDCRLAGDVDFVDYDCDVYVFHVN